MRLLVLGGNRYLGREIATQAVQMGWEVTCACRGESGNVPAGTRLVPWDRSNEPPSELVDQHWDSVVDVARLPSHVGRAVEAIPHRHWVFVSTISVYADPASSAMEPLLAPIHHDVDLASGPTAYGAMKVACEELVGTGSPTSTILRPGLIVGADDPSGRSGYWPRRLRRGGEVLAPGSPEDLMQVIDVRDLAAWILRCCERRTTGTFDAVGEPIPMSAVLTRIGSAVGGDAHLTWVGSEFLAQHGVAPWMGEDSIPWWLPRPEYDGTRSRDPGPAIAARLELRPIEDTALAMLDSPAIGISAEREAELLASWRVQAARR